MSCPTDPCARKLSLACYNKSGEKSIKKRYRPTWLQILDSQEAGYPRRDAVLPADAVFTVRKPQPYQVMAKSASAIFATGN